MPGTSTNDLLRLLEERQADVAHVRLQHARPAAA